jgi:TetR/AcrR family transcriptional regulator, mexCD-oprJ operon repressor
MAETTGNDSRRVTAERNLEAILDGAEELLARRDQPTISAVAQQAGVSRPTVYAHFPDRQTLLEALVERTVRRAMTAIDTAQLDRGPADEALKRLISSSWQQLATHDQVAHAAANELSADAMRAAHHTARDAIGRLVERGRREGPFRTDVPTSWLITATLALIHAAAEEVRLGQLDPGTALSTLTLTVTELFGRRQNPTGQ